VSKRPQKKHTTSHRSQQAGIMQTEDGIVSIEERAEWTKLRRPSDSKIRGESDLISGIPTAGDHYETNYQRQVNGVKTSNDQLTLIRRAGHRKVIEDPAQAVSQSRMDFDRMRNAHEAPTDNREHQTSSSPYAYTPQPMGGSLIKNIGYSLASRVEGPSVVPRQDNAPVNPHHTKKALLTENYNTNPGRQFIRVLYIYVLYEAYTMSNKSMFVFLGTYFPLPPSFSLPLSLFLSLLLTPPSSFLQGYTGRRRVG
jgi:hypothetical protein